MAGASKAKRRQGPLSGIRVLDLSRLAPGPFCTMTLGDLGADVIRIDAPADVTGRHTGDGRWRPPGVDAQSPFNALGRNKRSIGLNLKSAAGRTIFMKLARQADVLVEGFRPGVMERLGLGYSALRRVNRRLIYCAITGYGQTGPYRDLVGHDLNYIGMAGLLGIMGPAGGPPAIPHNLMADFAGGGLHAAMAILAALIARQRTGAGQLIDISMTDCVVSLQSFVLSEYLASGRAPAGGRSILDGGAPFYQLYRTRDHKWLSVAALEPRFFANLCDALGCPELVAHQYDRRHWPRMRRALAARFRARTRDHWFEKLAPLDTCVGKVYGYEELEQDPQLRHRGMFIRPGGGASPVVRQVGLACRLSGTPGSVRRRAPRNFQHTGVILKALGCSAAQVAALRRQGAVA